MEADGKRHRHVDHKKKRGDLDDLTGTKNPQGLEAAMSFIIRMLPKVPDVETTSVPSDSLEL
jgi:hypothetical protein